MTDNLSMPELSTKPYLLRAIYEWCIDAGLTPYVAVAVDESVRVPVEFVKNGEIVLNVSALATNRLKIGNDTVEFQARFGGVPRDVSVPIKRVVAIYARENGQGMAFDVPRDLPAGVEGPKVIDATSSRPLRPETATTVFPLAPPTVSAPADGDHKPPPNAPGSGDRPKLKRIK